MHLDGQHLEQAKLMVNNKRRSAIDDIAMLGTLDRLNYYALVLEFA